MKKTVAIFGQGYVGLPLALACSMGGWRVLGIEKSELQIAKINSGNHDLLSAKDKEELQKAFAYGNYTVTNDASLASEANVIVYCLPTPLSSAGSPDVSILKSALIESGPFIEKNTLLVLESTSFPGTARFEFAQFMMDSFPNCQNCYFAFSPERVDPNNKQWNISNTPRLVSGIDEKSLNLAIEFYSDFVKTIHSVDSFEIAELAKLIENSYRLINISFINELQMVSSKLNIPLIPAIEAAKTKSFGFQAFYPGAGIGGHCIPVDPVYLNWAAKQKGAPIRMIELAIEINNEVSVYISNKMKSLMSKEELKVLICGISYKKGVADTRETPAIRIVNELTKLGIQVFWKDLLIDEWSHAPKCIEFDSSYSGIIILQEVDEGTLNLAIGFGIPILDCTGSYQRPGVTLL